MASLWTAWWSERQRSEKQRGAWSLAKHFPELVAAHARGSLLPLGQRSCVRHTQQWPGRCPPLTTPGPVHLSGGEPLLRSAHARPQVTGTASGADERLQCGGRRVVQAKAWRQQSRPRLQPLHFPPYSHPLASRPRGALWNP